MTQKPDDYSSMPVSQHDEIATEALCQLYSIQEHLEEIGGAANEVVALALDTLSRSILNMTNASISRNRKTYVFLTKLFSEQNTNVSKALAEFESFVDGDTETPVTKPSW